MVSAGNRASTSFKQLSASEASQSRDALAKALYLVELVYCFAFSFSHFI